MAYFTYTYSMPTVFCIIYHFSMCCSMGWRIFVVSHKYFHKYTSFTHKIKLAAIFSIVKNNKFSEVKYVAQIIYQTLRLQILIYHFTFRAGRIEDGH